MKRAIVVAILGIAGSAGNALGQGQVQFVTYYSSGDWPRVVWGPGTGHMAGSPVEGSAGLVAELCYGIGVGLSWEQLSPIQSSMTTVGTLIPGSIFGGNVTLPVFSAGQAVTFGINILGPGLGPTGYLHSTWTEPSGVVVPIGLPTNPFTQSLLNEAYPNGIVPIFPEPGVITLTGLGAAALLAFLRSRDLSRGASLERK